MKSGIYAHLESFYNSIMKKSEPTYSILNSLKHMETLVSEKSQQLEEKFKNQSAMKNTITKQQIAEYLHMKEQKNCNDTVLRVLNFCGKIERRIQSYVNEQNESVREEINAKNKLFMEIYNLIGSFDEEINLVINENGEERFKQLRKKYLQRLQNTLTKQILSKKRTEDFTKELETILKQLQLPLKKNAQLPVLSPHSINFFSRLLFDEYCSYCLHKKIEVLLFEEDELEEEYDRSIFFQLYWYKIHKAVTYIFINPDNINEESNAYQIDEPNWLFQYMEQIFAKNYEFLKKILNSSQIPESLTTSISLYILHYNFHNFFLFNIKRRLNMDLQQIQKSLKQTKQSNEEQIQNYKFIVFNFLDQLHTFQQKLANRFNNPHLNLVEQVLILYDHKDFGFRLLDFNFDYEHYWIQTRIFNDFFNIDYSNINLKNIEAYNITLNYIQMFQKLYSKFQKVSNEKTKNQINSFYQDSLLKLVRHIKTSFERIFYHSGLDRHEIIIAFKRVEDQFRAYFGGFIQLSPKFQDKIKEQYYSCLTQSIHLYAVDELSPLHKKIIKKLTILHEAFTLGQAPEQKILQKLKDVFELWQEKMDKLQKLQPYSDPKLKNIFFVYIQSTQFQFQGYKLFIQIFEGYLKILYGIEGMRMIKMLIEMDKSTFKEYITAHPQMVSFLSNSELKSIQKGIIK